MSSYMYAPHNATYTNLYPKASHDGRMLKPSKPATEKQVSFLNTLIAERVIADELRAWLLAQIESGMSSRVASDQISSLMRAPKITKAQPKKTYVTKSEWVESTPGFYVDSNDNFFEVVVSKRKHKYAMGLVKHGSKFKWVYVPGAMKDFQQWTPVTAEVAQMFGKRYGICMVCARTLTDPNSIERGIGPYCAAKFGA